MSEYPVARYSLYCEECVVPHQHIPQLVALGELLSSGCGAEGADMDGALLSHFKYLELSR